MANSKRRRVIAISIGIAAVFFSGLCMTQTSMDSPVFAFLFSFGMILILEPIKHTLYDFAKKNNEGYSKSKQ